MGGGDNGYEAKQDAIENKKQLAREDLNYLFGIGDAPTRRKAAATIDAKPFMKQEYGSQISVTDADSDARLPAEWRLDEAAYKAAQDKAGDEAVAAAPNPNAGARDALYQGVRDSAFSAGKRRIEEDNSEAQRKLKFELFARGLNGGTADVDENAKLGRAYTQGIMDLGGKADAAKAGFRSDDEATRLQLLQSIDAGMDQGTALTSATNRMQVAADKASAESMGTTVGDLFSTGNMLYDQSQARLGRAQGGQAAWEMFPGGGSRVPKSNTATGVNIRIPGE